jgi:hypothetical protein
MKLKKNNRLIYLFYFAFLCLSYYKTYSQKSEFGNWFIYYGNQPINKKWSWWNEVQYRNYNLAGDLEQLMLRTGIGYNLTENNNNILLGFAHVISEPYINGTINKISFTENRIYQQFINRQNFGKIFIQHRYRLEERFLPTDFRVRFRYFLSLNIPFNNKIITKNTLYASAYNELFLNLNSPVFDRNRVYLALGYGINKYLRVETGLMYQLFENRNRPQFQLVLFNSIPYLQKKSK